MYTVHWKHEICLQMLFCSASWQNLHMSIVYLHFSYKTGVYTISMIFEDFGTVPTVW